MSDIKKFIEGSDGDLVDKDQVLKAGDWVLKWNPGAPDDKTGFELFTPKEFDPDKSQGPVGGLVLAAVYFLMEHGDRSFPRDLIDRANRLALEILEQKNDAKEDGSMVQRTNRVLN